MSAAERTPVDVTLRIDRRNLRKLVDEGDFASFVWLVETSPGIYELAARRPDDMDAKDWNHGWVNDGRCPLPPTVAQTGDPS